MTLIFNYQLIVYVVKKEESLLETHKIEEINQGIWPIIANGQKTRWNCTKWCKFLLGGVKNSFYCTKNRDTNRFWPD